MLAASDVGVGSHPAFEDESRASSKVIRQKLKSFSLYSEATETEVSPKGQCHLRPDQQAQKPQRCKLLTASGTKGPWIFGGLGSQFDLALRRADSPCGLSRRKLPQELASPRLLGNLRRKQAHGRLRCTSHPPTKVWDAPATAQPTFSMHQPCAAQPRFSMHQPLPQFRCSSHPPTKVFDAPATRQPTPARFLMLQPPTKIDHQDSRCSSHLTPQPSHPDQDFQCSSHPIFNAPRVPATWVWKFSMLQPPRNQDFRCFKGSCNMGLEIFDGVPELQSIDFPFP